MTTSAKFESFPTTQTPPSRPKATSVIRWVDAQERLPQAGDGDSCGHVFVLYGNLASPVVRIAKYDHAQGIWADVCNFQVARIKYWAEIPKQLSL
jgi:hypothetical protein